MIEFMLAAAAQVALMPPPAPPQPHPSWLAVGRDRYAERLRGQCMSERGVAAVIEIWWEARQPDPANLRREQAIGQELGQAAYTDPVDLPRLERALRASEAYQAEHRDLAVQEKIRVLRRLAHADRAIYARSLTVMQPLRPPKACSTAPAQRR